MTPPPRPGASTAPDLARRATAEFLGTLLLVTVVVGSGIAAQRLSDDGAVQLLASSTATALGLTVLILMFGPVSGAHLNPVVTAVEAVLARGTSAALSVTTVLGCVTAQVAGGVAGAVLANLMFDVPLTDIADTQRSGGHLLLGELVATAGLITLVFALARTHRGALAAPAVGAYIGSAYWFTSSTSFANPAVSVGRMFSDTYAGIDPTGVPGFIAAQMVGGAIGLALVTYLYPGVAADASDAVVPHEPHQEIPCATPPTPGHRSCSPAARTADDRSSPGC